MSKQDRQGVRQASDLEQKYNFGKSFAEVMGIATDAQKTAAETIDEVKNLDQKLDHDEIFNRLTNNGELQGLYRGDNGELHINGEYIKSKSIRADSIDIEELFTQDITMTGKFESTSQGYLPFTEEDYWQGMAYMRFPSDMPADQLALWDFNRDGVVDMNDQPIMLQLLIGSTGLTSDLADIGMRVADWEGAVKSDITIQINMLDKKKTIRIFGTNMWGTPIETYIGVDPYTSSFAPREYVDNMITYDPASGRSQLFQRDSFGNKRHFFPPMFEGIEYETMETWNGYTVYAKLVNFGALPNSTNKNVPHASDGEQQIISLFGTLSNGNTFTNGENHDRTSDVKFWVDTTKWNIRILTTGDMSDLTAYVAIKYIKN